MVLKKLSYQTHQNKYISVVLIGFSGSMSCSTLYCSLSVVGIHSNLIKVDQSKCCSSKINLTISFIGFASINYAISY